MTAPSGVPAGTRTSHTRFAWAPGATLGIVRSTVRVPELYEPEADALNVAFASTVPAMRTEYARPPPVFVTVAFRRIKSPGVTTDMFDATVSESRGLRIVTDSVRVVEESGTPLWSVPANAMSVDTTVPSGKPPITETVTLKENDPGAMLLNR